MKTCKGCRYEGSVDIGDCYICGPNYKYWRPRRWPRVLALALVGAVVVAAACIVWGMM